MAVFDRSGVLRDFHALGGIYQIARTLHNDLCADFVESVSFFLVNDPGLTLSYSAFDGRTNERTEERRNGRMDGRRNGGTEEWTDGRTEERRKGRTNKLTGEYLTKRTNALPTIERKENRRIASFLHPKLVLWPVTMVI